MKMKQVMAASLAAVMALAMTACGSDSSSNTTSDNESKGTLIMATNAEFPPYEYHEGDQIVGIDAEIAQAIADKLGYELQIEDMAFESIIPAVTSGKASFGMAGMTIDEDRLLSVDFSDSYATGVQVVIVKEGSDITSVDDGINSADGTDSSGFGGARPGQEQFASSSDSFITINGGDFVIVSTGDCVDSNGTLTINNGTLDLTCNGSGNTAIDCDGTYTNNGGDVTTNDGSENNLGQMGGQGGMGQGRGGH